MASKLKTIPAKVPGYVMGILANQGIERTYQEMVLNMSPQFYLGLDLNTQRSGYALLDPKGHLVCWGDIHAQTRKGSGASETLVNLCSLTDSVQGKLLDLADLVRKRHGTGTDGKSPSVTVIMESCMRSFKSAKWNVGLLTLAQLNGMVTYSVYETFQQQPFHVHPSRARGFFGLHARSFPAAPGKRTETLTAKAQAIQFALQHVKPATGSGQTMESLLADAEDPDLMHDRTDAFVLGMYQHRIAWIDAFQHDPSWQHHLDVFRREYLGHVMPKTRISKLLGLDPAHTDLEAISPSKARLVHAHVGLIYQKALWHWTQQNTT